MFWLIVTLIALCIWYRKEIAASVGRGLGKVLRESNYAMFKVSFSAGEDADMIPYLERVSHLQSYICKLVEHDLGKIPREGAANCLALPGIYWNPPDKLQHFELKLERDLWGDVIDRLNDMPKPSRAAYIKRLIREDMPYREELGMPVNAGVA